MLKKRLVEVCSASVEMVCDGYLIEAYFKVFIVWVVGGGSRCIFRNAEGYCSPSPSRLELGIITGLTRFRVEKLT